MTILILTDPSGADDAQPAGGAGAPGDSGRAVGAAEPEHLRRRPDARRDLRQGLKLAWTQSSALAALTQIMYLL